MKRCERWMFKVQDIAAQHGRVPTAGGRILPVDSGYEYKAINFVVQGSAYDVLAATICEMERRGVADHLQLAMHDEVVVDTEVANEVQQIMLTPPPFLTEWAQRIPILRTDRADLGHAWAKV
jgi:DNA polymerase-1